MEALFDRDPLPAFSIGLPRLTILPELPKLSVLFCFLSGKDGEKFFFTKIMYDTFTVTDSKSENIEIEIKTSSQGTSCTVDPLTLFIFTLFLFLVSLSVSHQKFVDFNLNTTMIFPPPTLLFFFLSPPPPSRR